MAHDPEGSTVLAQTLAAVQPATPVVALFSVLADKDWKHMMRQLAPFVSRFILTTAPSAPRGRSWNPDDAKSFADSESIPADLIRDFDDALGRAASLGATVLVTGSFHTVGDAMARLQLSPLAL